MGEIEYARRSGNNCTVLITSGDDRIAASVLVPLAGPAQLHDEERRKELAVGKAKRLAYALIAAIDAWETSNARPDAPAKVLGSV